jgi:uncharacterized membrane protein HdeD (DUF308 family)
MVDRSSDADFQAALAEARREIAEHWGWFLALGIALIVAGFLAIAFPFVSTIAAKIALGWIFLVTGVLMIVHAFSAGDWRGFVVSLLIGILYVVAGGYLAFFPLAGVLSLTIVVAALFLAEGVLELVLAFRLRPQEGWAWVLLSGLLAIAVGALIAADLPSSATWALGVLAGVNMLATGWSFAFLALAARRANTRASAVAA